MFAGTVLLAAYMVTVCTELIAVSVFRIRPMGVMLAAVILVNSFTHPLFIGYGVHIFGMPVFIAEGLIVLIEGFWYYVIFKEALARALLISFFANMASILAGIVVWNLYI